MPERTSTRSHLALVVALLLVQFAIRTHNLTVQEPYVDEAFHLARASIVYDFDQHPARFSHGKLLTYFWLGLFQPEPPGSLWIGRAGIALFALITGATIYAIGRRLGGHAAGTLALALYAVLPLAFFYERMAMADPLAGGLAALIAWRSLAFARRPTVRQGALLGLLLALVTFAKLTAALMPLLPVGASILYTPWTRQQSAVKQVQQWARRTIPPLVVAALVMGLLWLPVLIPAARVRGTDEAFVLVNSFNLRDENDTVTPGQYIERLPELAADFTSWGLLVALGIAVVFLVGPGQGPAVRRGALLVMGWAAVIAAVPVGAASLVTLRYFVPLSVPIALILALAAVRAWQVPLPGLRWVLRAGIVAAAGAWLIVYALPFLAIDLDDPADLPLYTVNAFEQQSGALIADRAHRQTAAKLDRLEPADAPLYANWSQCHFYKLYTARPITCLPLADPAGALAEGLDHDLASLSDVAYIALLSNYESHFERLDDLCWEQVIEYERAGNLRDLFVWRIYRGC
jgi:4-amino-4-deoxy-L-arabinose transferase-like glycosyltransferase